MATKVFISYAHESEKLSDAILDLSNYLRSQGIDSEIDQYEEAPAEGWPKWMMKQIQDANYVIIVCSELFFKRANDFSGKAEGLGVKWETTLILQQLYNINSNNQKYIPIIFNKSDTQYIPLPLQPYTHYNVSNQLEKDRLRNRLRGLTTSKRPPLGEEPETESKQTPLEPKERKSVFFSSIIDVDLWNQAKWKAMAFISDPSLKTPPIVGFIFDDNQKGNDIFTAIKKQIGKIDFKDEIRLSFIEEISDYRPQDYKVHIGTDWKVAIEKMESLGLNLDESFFIGLSRIHEMNPPNDSKNLEIFKHSYAHFKKYFITNFKFEKDKLTPIYANLIEKEKIFFRKKNDIMINKNDEDFVAFNTNETASKQ